MEAQKYQIITYLQQDDGYSECVTDGDLLALRFKRLKRKALLSIVNRYEDWVVSFPALDRSMNSNGKLQISVDSGVSQIISTCRLLALSHHDYDGDAHDVLEAAVQEMESNHDKDTHDKGLLLKSGSDGLEYRALVWVWRLAAYSLNQYCGAYEDWVCSKAEHSEMEELEKYSKEWYAAYVRYQEIVTLETLKEFAQQSQLAYTKKEHYDSEADEFFFRSTLCPVDTPGLKNLIYE
ncbi:unnamed protein product [Pseudo-nitzschia multistriata]|uniref:Uncharacterized protein n=1 Tax=Pseudo-nitzschia multistriata TaxID=183589 RepID=A0A448ZHB7_9STRA|nr:unnamed protein product [Pseudo-nitzschia multistriata]